jgi:hypothetical protein
MTIEQKHINDLLPADYNPSGKQDNKEEEHAHRFQL